MKRFLVLIALLLFLAFPAIVRAQQGYGDLSYDISQGTVTIRADGRIKTYEIALDEVWVTDGANEYLEEVSGYANAGALREDLAVMNYTRTAQRYLVLYREGSEHVPSNRLILRNHLALKLENPADAPRVAADHGLVWSDERVMDDGYAFFEASSTFLCLLCAEDLESDDRVEDVAVLLRIELFPEGYGPGEPNDPLFAPPNNWHHTLINSPAVWASSGLNTTGAGVLVAVFDGGIDLTHPDLSFSTPHLNILSNGTNLPVSSHGTSVSGVAAAIGNNGIGVVGLAPEALVTGVGPLAGSALAFSRAFLHRHNNPGNLNDDDTPVPAVHNNSWGFGNDDAYNAGQPSVLSAMGTASRLGTIIVFSAGNDGADGRRTDYTGYKNSPYAISVGAVGIQANGLGKIASYSEGGAALALSAPSSPGPGPPSGTVTTEVGGGYTFGFNGTSSAAPVVSGVIAAMREARPDLTYREANHILLTTATQANLDEPATEFEVNGAGIPFSYTYGAGLVNPPGAVAAAKALGDLFPDVQTVTRNPSGGSTTLPATIPDGNTGGQTFAFDYSGVGMTVEHVAVDVDFVPGSGMDITDLEIELSAPNGPITSVLNEVSNLDSNEGGLGWTYYSIRHWGEQAGGVWTLRIADERGNGVSGAVQSITMTIYGSSGGLNQPPVVTAAEIVPTPMAFDDEELRVTGEMAVDPEGDRFVFIYHWQESHNATDWRYILEGHQVLPSTTTRPSMAYRCDVRAVDFKGAVSVSPFYTNHSFVESRAPAVAFEGVPYEYPAGLWLPRQANDEDKKAVISEFSQGEYGDEEWVEIIVVEDGLDMRGWYLSNHFPHGSLLGRDVKFTNHSMWASVPAGTIIVIYNAELKDFPVPQRGPTERDPYLPPDDYTLGPGDNTLILPSTDTALFRLPVTGTGWGEFPDNGETNINLTNAAGDVADAVSINGDNFYTPALGGAADSLLIGLDPARSSAHCIGYMLDHFDQPGMWSIGSALPGGPASEPNISPGTWNNDLPGTTDDHRGFIESLLTSGTPSPRIRQYELGAATTAGWLSIDPNTGLVSGTPPTGSAGQYMVQVTCTSPWDTRTQDPYTLTVVAGAPIPLAAFDLDGDGAGIALEEAFHTDAQDAASTPTPEHELEEIEGAKYLSITFTRLKGGTLDPATLDYTVASPSAPGRTIRYTVQRGIDLNEWSSGPGEVVFEESSVRPHPADPDRAETVTYRTAAPIDGQECAFLRVQLTWEE